MRPSLEKVPPLLALVATAWFCWPSLAPSSRAGLRPQSAPAIAQKEPPRPALPPATRRDPFLKADGFDVYLNRLHRDDQRSSASLAPADLPGVEGLVIAGDLRLAAIGRAVYEEGDPLFLSSRASGYRIVSIEADGVTIEGEQGAVKLPLADAPRAGNADRGGRADGG